MSGRATLASLASFAVVWLAYALLVPPRPPWLVGAMTFAAIALSFVVAIACGAYIDTRRKDK